MEDTQDSEQIVALIPGGGWMIYRADTETGWSDPVAAWGLCANGDVVPLEADSHGHRYVYPVTDGPDVAEFWHPESSSPRAQGRRRQHRAQLDAGGG